MAALRVGRFNAIGEKITDTMLAASTVQDLFREVSRRIHYNPRTFILSLQGNRGQDPVSVCIYVKWLVSVSNP